MINNSLSVVLFILIISTIRSMLSSADTLAYSKCVRKVEQTGITFASAGTKSQGRCYGGFTR